MAYTAIYEGEECGAFEVPIKTDAYCLECGERMRVWREGFDGTARHFKHISEMGGGDTGGGGTDCGGGESDTHQKWKNFAAERLFEIFEDHAEVTVEKRLAAPHTDKNYRDADAALIFEEYNDQFGLGIAVEVQHKNLDKDIESTTLDYLKQDFSVVWLDKNDFSEDGCKLNEADFRYLAAESVPSLCLGSVPVTWNDHINNHVEIELDRVKNHRKSLNQPNCDHNLTEREYHVPAKIPNEHFDNAAKRIKENQSWSSLFDSPETDKFITQAVVPRSPTTTITEVPLPKDVFTDLRKNYWENTDFSEKLNPPRQFSFNNTSPIPATFPEAWGYKAKHYRLTENNSDQKCDLCNSDATVYVHERGFRCGACGPWPENRQTA
jgi:hypothetical protein